MYFEHFSRGLTATVTAHRLKPIACHIKSCTIARRPITGRENDVRRSSVKT